ncbi:MAG: cupin domain-containing protein [Polyangiaceae bacterium]
MNQPPNTAVQSEGAGPASPSARIADGVELRELRRHEAGGRTFLIRMERGARAPRHGHPGGEETYLVSGRLRITDRVDVEGNALSELRLSTGDYEYSPPGELHAVVAEDDAVLFVVAPGGVSRSAD